jgi:MYXO-CTERM domain-containing protein
MQAAENQGNAQIAVSDRSTTFSAVDDSGPPTSMKVFGVVFGVLWLGMLALVFLARRRQVRLRAHLDVAERALFSKS